jgi:DNA-binding transcriptional ArsR family regulator
MGRPEKGYRVWARTCRRKSPRTRRDSASASDSASQQSGCGDLRPLAAGPAAARRPRPAVPESEIVKQILDYCGSLRTLSNVLNYYGSLDRVFQALADPTRRDIVERLTRGPASVSALAEPLDMSLPAVMQHLQVLESCGLIRSEKAGRVRTCHIETAALRAAESWLARQRTAWEVRLDRLGDHLTETETDDDDQEDPS